MVAISSNSLEMLFSPFGSATELCLVSHLSTLPQPVRTGPTVQLFLIFYISADCIALATHCSLEIQQNHDWQMTSVGVELRVKIAIAAGKIYCTHVGLPGQVRHIAMSGNPVGEVNAAEKHCESGDVVLSSNAWDLCNRGTFKGFEVGDGKYKFFKVKFMTRKNFSPDEFESWKAPNPYPMIR